MNARLKTNLAASVALLEDENIQMERAIFAARENAKLRAECAALGIEPPRLTMKAIIAEVATRHGLTAAELCSSSTAHYIAHPRQEAMYLMRQVQGPAGGPRWSLAAIARALGGMDHTTVLHGIRAHKKRNGGPSV